MVVPHPRVQNKCQRQYCSGPIILPQQTQMIHHLSIVVKTELTVQNNDRLPNRISIKTSPQLNESCLQYYECPYLSMMNPRKWTPRWNHSSRITKTELCARSINSLMQTFWGHIAYGIKIMVKVSNHPAPIKYPYRERNKYDYSLEVRQRMS